jgi:hypothetical protein
LRFAAPSHHLLIVLGFGLCCDPDSRHFRETVFEHTCTPFSPRVVRAQLRRAGPTAADAAEARIPHWRFGAFYEQ